MADLEAPRLRRRRDRPEWLSLGAAARFVGVDPDTLRRWADSGRLEVFTTPGGHRRFRRRSLEALTAERRRRPSLTGLGATPDRLAAAYRRAYRRLRDAARRPPSRTPGSPVGLPAARLASADGTPPATPIRAVDAAMVDDRAAFRADGRRLLEALVAYLEAEGSARADREVVAAECVTRMARQLASEGRSLAESVASFVLARRPFLAELRRLGERRRLDAAYLGCLYDDAAALLDRLLLAFVAAFRVADGERAPGERVGEPKPWAQTAADRGS